ncbi:adenosylhomocysteinase [Candidatus Nitrosotenuis chungbukensis]|uniref:adenosylhomocysteinase n=1 Tax=Candidatus Nitrosotenuis chungbukensis TaxID=1353246 RepID=UPI0005B27FC8
MGKIKDPAMSDTGNLSHNWAKSHMRILTHSIDRLKELKPLRGITLGFCLQITKETSVLLIGAKELGAKVVACSGNPLTTQDNIAAFLASNGIEIFAWSNQTKSEYDWCQNKVLSYKPDIIVDDGGDLNTKAHFDKKFQPLKILGATEETTTGITRYNSMQKKGKLRYPIIAVNNAKTKTIFDNKYGTGQSTIAGYLHAMNLLFASKRVVVCGYGWLGKGVAQKCAGMGSRIIVIEIDPIRALEAHMDGFDVMPMSRAAKIGDIFITCTGMRDVIQKKHLLSMKNGAIVGNVGHFDVEIDSKFLLKQKVRQVRPNLDECVLPNGKKIHLISKGRVANLIASEGHPPEIMALSFSNQLYSILYILKNHKKMRNLVYDVPEQIDYQVAVDALNSMNVKIDRLSKKQIAYKTSW